MEALRQWAEFQNADVVPGLTISAGMGVVQRPSNYIIIMIELQSYFYDKI